jgi:hypothetical protein
MYESGTRCIHLQTQMQEDPGSELFVPSQH